MLLNKLIIRDVILSVLMISVSLYVFFTPQKKYDAAEKINLASSIPSSFNDWESTAYDTSDYNDKWQSINELLARTYYNKNNQEELDFILEYSSDLRKNFSFHFPEICLRSGGNQVIFLDPLEIAFIDSTILQAKCLYIKGLDKALVKEDRIIVYWLMIDNKKFYKTLFIKLDQMLTGLLGKSKKGFLIRVDCSSEAVKHDDQIIQKTREAISNFIEDLYDALDKNKRKMLFGA